MSLKTEKASGLHNDVLGRSVTLFCSWLSCWAWIRLFGSLGFFVTKLVKVSSTAEYGCDDLDHVMVEWGTTGWWGILTGVSEGSIVMVKVGQLSVDYIHDVWTWIITIIAILAELSNCLQRQFNDFLHDYWSWLFYLLTFCLHHAEDHRPVKRIVAHNHQIIILNNSHSQGGLDYCCNFLYIIMQ